HQARPHSRATTRTTGAGGTALRNRDDSDIWNDFRNRTEESTPPPPITPEAGTVSSGGDLSNYFFEPTTTPTTTPVPFQPFTPLGPATSPDNASVTGGPVG